MPSEEVVEKSKISGVPIEKVKIAAVTVAASKITEIAMNVPLKKGVNVLYAQPKENGFQLVNMKPAVVFTIFKTSLKDIFIIKDKNGTLYKKDGSWIAEYYENGKLIGKQYQIKF
ncbi:MAG: hypothetical protein ACWIPI_02745 [Polaribacter sp.]